MRPARRNPREIEITAGRAALDLDSVHRYEDLGVAAYAPPPAFDRTGSTPGSTIRGSRHWRDSSA